MVALIIQHPDLHQSAQCFTGRLISLSLPKPTMHLIRHPIASAIHAEP